MFHRVRGTITITIIDLRHLILVTTRTLRHLAPPDPRLNLPAARTETAHCVCHRIPRGGEGDCGVEAGGSSLILISKHFDLINESLFCFY